MDRIVLPANEPPAASGHAPFEAAGAVSIASLLSGAALPEAGLIAVLPDDGSASERGPLLARLAAAHTGAPNHVVVATATAELAMGQRGALAGLPGPFVAPRELLAAAMTLHPTSLAELRWLLWNDGAVVTALAAVEERPRAAPDCVLADRVPLRDLRDDDLDQATTPTISFVVHGGTSLTPFDTLPASARRPSEVLVVGGGEARLPSSGRIRAVVDLDEAVATSRGALVWFVHDGATVDREAWARCLRRFEDDRVEVVRSAYRTPGGVVRSSGGMLEVDAAVAAPVFAAVRRRALRKQRGPLAELWPAAVAREREAVVLSHPVDTQVAVVRAPVPGMRAAVTGVRDLAARGREVVTSGGEVGADDAVSAPGALALSVGWVGFSGHANFGDEVVLRAARQLLPGVELRPGAEGEHGTVLGGGTLLNADHYYQRMAERIDAPWRTRLVLGTGVVSPQVGGWSEPLEGWQAFLEAGPVGLRGPASLEHLRAWGYDGPAEVIGDPGLALVPAAEPVAGRVVLSPVGSSNVGQIETDDEHAQVALLAASAAAWRAEGREVVILSAHTGDDRMALALVRAIGDASLPVVHGHRDVDAGLELLASAALVVGTRLHAVVMAAAAGTPFVGLAYRPKVMDFARSVAAGALVRPVDAWDTDSLAAAAVTATSDEQRGLVAAEVARWRAALEARGAGYVETLRAGAR